MPGLRREELAQLARVSVTYYTRLEQGNAHNVSVEVLDAISGVLKLSDAEHAHLLHLAKPKRHKRPPAPQHQQVRSAVLDKLSAIEGKRALLRRGVAAPLETRGGLDVRPVDMGAGSLDAMAEYLAKITAEVTAQVVKQGRNGNRSPMAILRDALATGLADDCELWLEWERASHNRRQLTWSRGLREWSRLHRERSDQEVAERDHHGDDVVAIAPDAWPEVRPHLAELLDVAEREGIVGAKFWLTARGYRWSPPPQAPAERGGLALNLVSEPITKT